MLDFLLRIFKQLSKEMQTLFLVVAAVVYCLMLRVKELQDEVEALKKTSRDYVTSEEVVTFVTTVMEAREEGRLHDVLSSLGPEAEDDPPKPAQSSPVVDPVANPVLESAGTTADSFDHVIPATE